MISYWFNVVGIGLNFIATILLLWNTLNTTSAEGTTVMQPWEREFSQEFQSVIKNGRRAIVLLMIGFGFQFFAVLLQYHV